CVDTSMGLTPLEGLIMGTRSGDLDPAIIEFIAQKENKSVSEVLNILNKKSGVYGLSNNMSSDFRDIENAYFAGDEMAIMTMKTYAYRVAKYVGAYTAAMNGVDAIAFTAGVGENGPLVRSLVCSYLGYLGIELDEEQNNKRGDDTVISTPDSKVTVMFVPTNEELAIARETLALI
ncbi:MAG: acetate kinase, partial [Lachnospiraceae bacterium]|nr:acetate kinase [Lachnospiraceae bacterium]